MGISMKLYKVCDYHTGKKLLIGTAEECAKLTGFKKTKHFQSFVWKIENGEATGKKIGYTAYKYSLDDEIHKNNLKILDKFYDKYLRSPTINEFKKCGGDYLFVVRNYNSYNSYLELCGYCKVLWLKTIEVYDSNGELCYTGTAEDVSEEFNYNRMYIANLIRIQKPSKSGYRFKYKEFDGI